MNPAVSVVIPFRGRIRWLREAVDSVLAQTFRDFELILVDDGSLEDVSGEPWVRHGLVRYVRQDPRGPGAARNHGVRLARGMYVAFLDSDDLFLPEKLEVQYREMEARPDVALSHTSYERVDAEGRFLEVIDSGAFTGRVYPGILNRCVIATPTVMVRRVSFRDTPFDESARVGEDVILWVRIARHHEILGIRKPLARVRMHGENAALLPEAQLEGSLNILRAAFREDRSFPAAYRRDAYAKVFNGVANRYQGEGKHQRALGVLLAGMRYAPANREILGNVVRTMGGIARAVVPARYHPALKRLRDVILRRTGAGNR
ncbi:MAG TPA: glycosyltransferase family A protein [Candidatus Deferrimicrobiaceae bacterium]